VEIVVVILAFALLGVVLLVVSGPLRSDRVQDGREAEASWAQRADLEAAREAKYREIRDAELDLRTGKLSRADYESIDGALRAEALQILDRLQALDEPADGAADGEPAANGGPARADGEPARAAQDEAGEPAQDETGQEQDEAGEERDEKGEKERR
jgi:hypothetical protein